MEHSPRFLAIAEDALCRVREIAPEELQKIYDTKQEVTILDVREDSEWEAGHLPQAVHLCKGILERDVEKVIPDVNTPIVLYCGGGYRSALAADNLQKMGYQNVLSLKGGYKGWCAGQR